MWRDICFVRKAQGGQIIESFSILHCKTVRHEFYLQTHGVVCKFLTCLITLNRGPVLKTFSVCLFLFSILHLHLELPFLKRSSILHSGVGTDVLQDKNLHSVLRKGIIITFCHVYSIMSKRVYLLFMAPELRTGPFLLPPNYTQTTMQLQSQHK